MKDYVTASDYKKKSVLQFCHDMEDAGFDLEHYHGRGGWQGPAVVCDHIADAMHATTVKCQFDNMGTRYIVYPLVGERLED